MICAQDAGVSLIEHNFSQKKSRAVIPLGPLRERVSCPSDSIPYTIYGFGRLFNTGHIWIRQAKLYDGLIDPVFFPLLQIGPSPGKSPRNVGLDVERVFVTASESAASNR
jgi:hypothetical protein